MTLRSRITGLVLAALAPLALATGLGLYFFVRASLYERLDDTLDARADALAAATKWHNGVLEFDFEDAAMPQYQAADDHSDTDGVSTAYFEIWRLPPQDRQALPQLFESSRSLGQQTLLDARRAPERLLRDSTGSLSWNADLPDEADVRVLARLIQPAVEFEGVSHAQEHPSPAPVVAIVVAVSRESVDRPLGILAAALVATGAVLTLTGVGALRWAVAHALMPVEALAAQVSTIDPAKPGAKLHAPQLSPEFQAIQDRVNALLGRIDDTIQRERRWTAAAAHELRTPVAELLTLLEVSSSRNRTASELTHTTGAALESVRRLHDLVATLLRLARIDSGMTQQAVGTARLARAVHTAVNQAAPTATLRGLSFAVAVPGDLQVNADTDLLGLALRNLIMNAAEYADPGSTIEITAALHAESAELHLINEAATLQGIDASLLSEPFWRADPSRASSRGHLGVGITVSHAALLACGASLELALVQQPPLKLHARVRMKHAMHERTCHLCSDEPTRR